jgi:glycosyltransferase involved in cell wall biosynthesis
MRILHILPPVGNHPGAAKQSRLLVAGLPREEFSQHLCVLGRSGSEEPPRQLNGATVLDCRWAFDPRAIWRLKILIERFRPDIVHAWAPPANAYGCAALRLSRLRSADFIASYRSAEPWRTGWQLRIERRVGRSAQCLTANSSSAREFYSQCGLPREKFQVIANGVAPLAPSPATRRQLLAELGLPDSSRLIGMVGRLTLHKRIKDAIWAADLMKVIRKDVHLLVVGDGPHRARLEKFRDQVRIFDLAHFLGSRGDADRLFPHFDLFWSTSAYEGQSNPMLEAMAAGVPVVAADIPGNRDLITPGENGVLVPVGDRTGFAQVSHQLLEDPARRRRLGEAGRERILRDFSVEAMVRRYAELYRRLRLGNGVVDEMKRAC